MNMNLRWLALLTCILLTGARQQPDTECPKCDCGHFPIDTPDCVKCCFSAKIVVTSTSSTSVTGRPISGEEKREETFRIEKATRINGRLQAGATATVYYHRMGAQQVATRIDELRVMHGALVPGSAPGPPDTCEQLMERQRMLGRTVAPIPEDAMKIFFGDSEAFSTEQRVVVWKISDEETLVLQKTDSGIFVSLKIRGPDGKTVAELVDNEFFVNLGNAYHMEQSSPNTLVLSDNHRDRILDIQYLNPKVVKILGKFYGPNGESMTITENEQTYTSKTGAKLITHHSCFGGGTGLIELRADGTILVR